MRCMNCGWENPDNLTKCEKCNSPLNVNRSLGHKPVMEQGGREEVSSLKGTISERRVFEDSIPEVKNPECPECGYPLRVGMKHCPNCGADVERPIKAPTKPQPVSEKKFNATVNPWANPNAGRCFTLKPVPWDNERTEPSELSFVGDSIELNRANTDPSNNTITSKVQAEISYVNGRWLLKDRSSQGTTYVHAGKEIILEDGAVIMLGNRKFVFKVE